MFLKYLISGFFVKIIAGFDDTLTRIPIAAQLTKTRRGRFAFAGGIFLAICLAIAISFLFASFIKSLPYFRYISATLIFILAVSIYFDVFFQEPKKQVEKKVKRIKKISTRRIFKLIGIGFLTAFATLIDDTIAYSSLFLGDKITFPYVLIGIFIAVILQLAVIIYFSKKIMKFKWKKEVTTIGLLILAVLILSGVL
jgi:magnesium-transporting ATPase (P-type)